MGIVSRGFGARPGLAGADLPPGQYLTEDFPVLSAGPTPAVSTEDWRLEVDGVDGPRRSLDWEDLLAMDGEEVVVDLHCVTRWSKLGTTWRGVPVEAVLEDTQTEADYALVRSYGGYSTNLPLEDLLDGKAWIAYEYEGDRIDPEHGGPARLLVPHLYLWKSAKWVKGIELRLEDQPGFWESLGYHEYGDPWREQRYAGD